MHKTQHRVTAVGLCSQSSGVCVVCCHSKSDSDLDAVTEVVRAWFVVSKSESDRYFMALYRKLLDPALRSSAKQPQFLNLLYKSMKDDIMDRRVKVGRCCCL